MRVLVVNAGSSSLKLSVLDDNDAVLGTGGADLAGGGAGDGGDAVGTAVGALLETTGPVDAVGHRIVHGGPGASGPALVDAGLLVRLRRLVPLAPLHQPVGLRAVETVGAALPGTPVVACFDTAFFAGLPAETVTYPLPADWRRRHGLRRFGFHGLSHAYCGRRSAELLGRGDARVVVAHVGSGVSLSALAGGRPMDTTMGFTPLEGVMMATRSGSVDPGLVLFLLQQGHSVDEVNEGLVRRSGLLGLAGSADMREVLARRTDGDADASLAVDVYLHRLAAGVAAMAVSLRGLDALVLTGGVGQAAAPLRAELVERLDFLGVTFDAERNAAHRPTDDADLTGAGAGSAVRTLVLATREDVEIARGVRALLAP